jgi:U4/U6.U5 tri-snRNP-associated protein 2
MAKRQAEEALQDEVMTDSPVSKKIRYDGIHSSGPVSNGSSSRSQIFHSNGHGGQFDDDADNEIDEIEEESNKAASALIADIDEDASAMTAPKRQIAPTEGYTDLYLDTINRSVLDFDFEKLCSVSLSNINVYACLVCGRYYQGRGMKSHAYFHSLEVGHHVFVNMETLKVYALPEGYEVTSASLADIKYVVDPRYTKEEVAKLDREEKTAWDLGGKQYIPGEDSPLLYFIERMQEVANIRCIIGFVGLNNIKQNDYFNVIIHALAHVPPLRNFLMLEDLSSYPELVQRFSILVRKIWNPRAFKSHVSPHELLQEISLRSNKKFTLTTQADPMEFLSWFLNNLHLALGGSKTKPGSSIVQRVFQGKLKVESQEITAKADAGDRLRFEEAAEVKVDTSRFLMLTLDLPNAPLFRDDAEENIIPQVGYSTLSRNLALHLANGKRYP